MVLTHFWSQQTHPIQTWWLFPLILPQLKTAHWLETLKGPEANSITVQLPGLHPVFVAAVQLDKVLPL